MKKIAFIPFLLMQGILLAQHINCVTDLSKASLGRITSQSSSISASIDENNLEISLTGNAWNTLEIPTNIFENTLLEFEFKSNGMAEEQGIGFANNLLSAPNGSRFKLDGTQNIPSTVAFQDFEYTGNGEWQYFSIPVGEYLTGNFAYIVFVNDNDAEPSLGNVAFRNIRITDSFDNCALDSSFLKPEDTSVDLAFNFGSEATPTVEGFIKDTGAAYGAKSNLLKYGWVSAVDNNPLNVSKYGTYRVLPSNQDFVRASFIAMNSAEIIPKSKWEIKLPNGNYRVVIQAGDAQEETVANTHHYIEVEGIEILNFTKENTSGTLTAVSNVVLTDGRLSIESPNGFNTKINAVAIQSSDVLKYPAVIGSIPLDGAENVSLTTSISANFLSLPNTNDAGLSSLDNTTIDNTTVQLFEISDDDAIPVTITVNGTGGGDAINISTVESLLPYTRYRYVINGVKDLAGATVFPFSAEFTTGAKNINTNNGDDLDDIFFKKIDAATGGYTSLTIGPDSKLYGLMITGEIRRWTINEDGTLSNMESLKGLQENYGAFRLAIGLAFSPESTTDNLVAYVTHSSFVFNDGPAYDGKLSKLSGEYLENEELILDGLPRSVRDHLTNSIVFDPNNPNILLFNQGSNTAGGAADSAWGGRPERLLTAATLKLNLSLLPSELPLNVQTSEDISVINSATEDSLVMNDGFYNPYATDAPLTIFASGIRNAYDLVWHSNGQIYVPTNGTAGGSNSPASELNTRRPNGTFYNGPEIPEVSGNNTQKDFLFRINPDETIGYYGHPNPLRGEYVLNHGSESTEKYPSGILPDSNYRGFAFDFEFNKSPNGVIEYTSEGPLQGAIIVCRYSGGSDLIALLPDEENGDIGTSKIGIPGFTGFNDPLDLVEDPSKGNIYVADFSDNKIVLLTLSDEIIVQEDNIEVSFNTPTNEQIFNSASEIGIEVLASSTSSPINDVKLFLDGVLVRQENIAPYEWGVNNSGQPDLMLQNLSAGTYELTAVATDNQGNIAEEKIIITIDGDGTEEEEIDEEEENNGESEETPVEFSISFATPANGDVFSTNDSLGVEVINDGDGVNIQNIQLFINDQLVRQENLAPFEWGSNNINTSDAYLENLEVGVYELLAIATDSNGNTAQSLITVSVISSEVEEEIDENNLLLHPNPFVDKLSLSFDSLTTGEIVKVEIVDLAGFSIFSEIFTYSDADILLDLSTLQKGSYFINVISGLENVTHTEMIIKN